MTSGAPTYFSLPSILASRYPLGLGREIVGIAPGEATLASELRCKGYATACFSAANPYVSKMFGYDQGFDVFQDFLCPEDEVCTRVAPSKGWKGQLNRYLAEASQQFGPFGAVYDELYFQYCQRISGPAPTSLDELRRFPSADVLISSASEWLESLGSQPFFLWLHLMDPHAPYYPADQAMVRTETAISPSRAKYLNSYWSRSDLGPSRLQSKKKEIIDLYDAAVYWVDTQLSRLVQKLMSHQRWHDCLFAVTADHGEEFLDHGGRFHPPNRLHEELIHVPLVVRVPEGGSLSLDVPFSLLDLAPTLLEGLSVEAPRQFQGKSRWGNWARSEEWNDACVAEAISGCTNPFVSSSRLCSRVMVVRHGRYKLHLQFGTAEFQLFDLVADPQERFPIPDGEQSEVRRRLLGVAYQHLQQSMNQKDTLLRLRSKLRELQLQLPQSSNKPEYVLQ